MTVDRTGHTEPTDPLDGLTSAACRYLQAIWSASEWSDTHPGITELAGRLGVATSTVSDMLPRLVAKGLVAHEPYSTVRLTAFGTTVAATLIRRQRLLETFLVEHLGYGWHEVHDDADLLAHAASERAIAAIDDCLGHPTRDPHGDPIPTTGGVRPPKTLIPLSACTTGHSGRIARVDDSDGSLLEYFDQVGMTLDAEITVTATHPFAGTMTVSTPDAPTAIMLGDVAARSIWIAPRSHPGVPGIRTEPTGTDQRGEIS